MNQDRTESRILLRRGRAEDLDAMVALERRAFTGDHLSRRQYAHHLRSHSAEVVVAMAGAVLCGKALLFFRRGQDIARLYSIAVAHEARGQGLGEKLLLACEHAAIARGCKRLRLEVRQDNPGAQRLYERLGYQRFGARSGYYEDGADAWRYEKALSLKD
ncbi:GNAT family N-acetyltransferase [Pseudolysobacter antarcticus]|uniref:GNAT family N-acetyltransferase n=1 Tax=Pseudolysobacter antarcticus TaxID=2511995 RepID=A0A411HP35_9GAMM|nr:GNAT family N-acetyltransferase [Pseudolysobacter antarcticus]QBB72245.1 GNAT family N-acetyltransferase [Pseudolysobacter antarcticus]